ncbi:MAG TPA: hypothetical protein VIM69_10390, partial [Opitutaceae bacterium]
DKNVNPNFMKRRAHIHESSVGMVGFTHSQTGSRRRVTFGNIRFAWSRAGRSSPLPEKFGPSLR